VRRRRPGRPPVLLPAEIQAIMDGCAAWDEAAGDWAGNLRDRLIFAMLAETGMFSAGHPLWCKPICTFAQLRG